MKNYDCQYYIQKVRLGDQVSLSVFRDKLKDAVYKSDSKEPDSLGDKLFRCSLEFSFRQGNNTTDVEFLEKCCVLMNQYEVDIFPARVKKVDHIKYAIYQVDKK